MRGDTKTHSWLVLRPLTVYKRHRPAFEALRDNLLRTTKPQTNSLPLSFVPKDCPSSTQFQVRITAAIAMASATSTHTITKTDRAYVQMLKTKADKLREDAQIPRAKNYLACSAYIQSHGVPYEDPKTGEPLILYAVGGKAHVVSELVFKRLVALKPKKGPLHDSKQELCIVVCRFLLFFGRLGSVSRLFSCLHVLS